MKQALKNKLASISAVASLALIGAANATDATFDWSTIATGMKTDASAGIVAIGGAVLAVAVVVFVYRRVKAVAK